MNASKVVRVISYFLFGLIFLFLILTISFNYYVNKKFSAQVKDKFSEKTDFKYVLSFDKLSINLFTQRVSINNVVVSPIKNSASSAEFFITASYFKIIDFSVLTYLKTKNLEIDKVEVINPNVSFYLNDSVTTSKPAPKNDISQYIKKIFINHIEVVNCNFNVYCSVKDSIPFLESFKNSISLNSISINLLKTRKDSLYTVKDVDVVLNKVKFTTFDSLYSLSGNQIHASLSQSLLVIDSLQLMPNYSKKEFANKAKFQTSRVSVSTSKIILHHFDFQKLLSQHAISSKKVEISSCLLSVYRDNTKELQSLTRPSLQRIIKSIPVLVNLDTIELKNGRIDFEALQPSAPITGKIFIDNVNLSVFDVNNDTIKNIDDKVIKADFEGDVLGKAKFTESYMFPLKANGESFSCSGSLSAMPLSGFNSIIIPAKQLMFQDGQLDDVTFSFVAKQNVSSGTMVFKYHDLKIEVLKKDNSKGGVKAFVSTLLLNNYAINKSNPNKDGKVITAKLSVKNNPYRYFLFYSMQTILSGIEPTIIKKRN